MNISIKKICAQDNTKPNLLIFYSDDQGWGETGCYGNNEIPTPNIDALAANGIRFTQGYVAATSPTMSAK